MSGNLFHNCYANAVTKTISVVNPVLRCLEPRVLIGHAVCVISLGMEECIKFLQLLESQQLFKRILVYNKWVAHNRLFHL